jgi:hypothetical protein
LAIGTDSLNRHSVLKPKFPEHYGTASYGFMDIFNLEDDDPYGLYDSDSLVYDHYGMYDDDDDDLHSLGW